MRTQSSVAISNDDGHWFLINASPDLRAQIESFMDLHPLGAVRDSPIRDVLLTNADFDHVLGLFLVRERSERLRVHCTAAVRATLHDALRIDKLLDSYCGIEWRELWEGNVVQCLDKEPGSLAYRAISLPGAPPRYAPPTDSSQGQSVALEFVDPRSGARLLVAPDVAAITPDLRSALEAADMVLFDGTFWSEDELRRIDPTARLASDMGHLPISGGSLELLRGLPARHRIYTHINNTNPIFAPDSPERAEVENAGITIGVDGMEFAL